jgi:hypothetical protein
MGHFKSFKEPSSFMNEPTEDLCITNLIPWLIPGGFWGASSEHPPHSGGYLTLDSQIVLAWKNHFTNEVTKDYLIILPKTHVTSIQ